MSAGLGRTGERETLSPADLGLAKDAVMPFCFEPAEFVSPLVISLPHVGLAWPAELGSAPAADLARHSDFEVQQLYRDAAVVGAARLRATYSRLVVDLNRAPDDISRDVVPDHPRPRPRNHPGSPADEIASEHPPGTRGVVWQRALGGAPVLAQALSFAEFSRRLARYHEPYWRALSLLLQRRRDRFGYAVLLDAHSMPGSIAADLVLGTLDGRSCGRDLEHRAQSALTGPLLRLHCNQPYRGGAIVEAFGRPDKGQHALQLEVSRALYMDEDSWRLRQKNSCNRSEFTLLAELEARVKCLLETLAQIDDRFRVPAPLSHNRTGE